MEDVQIKRSGGLRSPRFRLEALFSRGPTGVPLLDIGTTSLTGLRTTARPTVFPGQRLTDPVFRTMALDPEECLGLGSDFIRTGVLYDPQALKATGFKDGFGVEWLNSDGYLVPGSHPLEGAKLREIERYPKPEWRLPLQSAGKGPAEGPLVMADAPCPGLLDSCFRLRGPWKFMEDIAEKRPAAGALLEWSLETIVGAYEYLLSSLGSQPDVLIYGDDLGFQNSMFLSPADFRTYLLPVLSTLAARLRKLTPAALCFHSCGAISPILKDIAGLGFEILNLDTYAKGMEIRGLRGLLPRSVILHGTNDLCALGEVVARRDRAGIAYFITELAQSWPVIAAPTDSLASAEEVDAAVRGAAFIKGFSDDDFALLQRLGPVRSAIEAALAKILP